MNISTGMICVNRACMMCECTPGRSINLIYFLFVGADVTNIVPYQTKGMKNMTAFGVLKDSVLMV